MPGGIERALESADIAYLSPLGERALIALPYEHAVYAATRTGRECVLTRFSIYTLYPKHSLCALAQRAVLRKTAVLPASTHCARAFLQCSGMA